MADWQPIGKFVLLKLHTRSSLVLVEGEEKYTGTAEVLGVGADVPASVQAGDEVLIGPIGIVFHPKLGEDVALLPITSVLGRRPRPETITH